MLSGTTPYINLVVHFSLLFTSFWSFLFLKVLEVNASIHLHTPFQKPYSSSIINITHKLIHCFNYKTNDITINSRVHSLLSHSLSFSLTEYYTFFDKQLQFWKITLVLVLNHYQYAINLSLFIYIYIYSMYV